ncbi:class I adenylate-forming enzyme family protein [Actinomycetospora flava]|uniref:AMP-binding protein n=1 Tax=Actinomycetospora flava TaxID=3129232 RepID=A0ABU8M542_9PSEU
MTAVAAAPSEQNVLDMLGLAALRAHDAPAVRDRDGAWTYAELDAAADRVAGRLAELGVGPGDRVVLRSPNRREVPALLFGTWRVGAALVPLSPRLPFAGLATVVADAAPAVVVTGAGDVLEGDVGPVTSVEHLVSGPRADARRAVDDADLALLVYTSGSTSTPKGVVCPRGAVEFAARAIAERLRYRADDVVLVGSPMSFDYGLYQVLLSVLAGAELVLTDAEDPIGMLRTLRETRATVVPIVPSSARMLVRLARRGATIGHVRLFTNTGAALTTADIAGLRGAFDGASVVAMYGITECKRVTIAEPDVDLQRPGSVGTALPGTQVQILDEDGLPVAPGVEGEIAPVGPHVMDGYWRSPELSAGRFDHDPRSGSPRLRTGDYGHLDADGHLYFHGRRDDQIKRRGVRMSLIEIEAAAVTVPGVVAAAALPPDGEHDLELVVVGDRPGSEVLDALRELVEPAKVPDLCHGLDELPLTTNGKTDRKRLRQLVQPDLGRTS